MNTKAPRGAVGNTMRLLHAQATDTFDRLSEPRKWFDGPERADHERVRQPI